MVEIDPSKYRRDIPRFYKCQTDNCPNQYLTQKPDFRRDIKKVIKKTQEGDDRPKQKQKIVLEIWLNKKGRNDDKVKEKYDSHTIRNRVSFIPIFLRIIQK